MSELKSMAMSAEEAKNSTYAYPGDSADNLPRYPYGLQLDLQTESLEKLGLQAMPDAGQTMMITARVKVTNVSQSDMASGKKHRCVGLQITDMDIGPDTAKPSAESKLYGGDGG